MNARLLRELNLLKKEDFETAEAHGFREVLPNMTDKWFWPSAVFPGSSYYAYGLYHGNYAVRCVER